MYNESTPINVAGDYLCLNRLRELAGTQKPGSELDRLLALFEQLEDLPTGRRGELPFPVLDGLWARICAVTQAPGGQCICGAIYGCYYRQALQEKAEREAFKPTVEDLIAYVHRDDDVIIVRSAEPEDAQIVALKTQIAELQAEVEGLRSTRICKNCKYWGQIGTSPIGFCKSGDSFRTVQTSCPGFGCLNFTAKEGS